MSGYSHMRNIAKRIAERDREYKSDLIRRRRALGIKQEDIDKAFGYEQGTTKRLEAYDSDPRMSEMRRYEAFITVMEFVPGAEEVLTANQKAGEGLI